MKTCWASVVLFAFCVVLGTAQVERVLPNKGATTLEGTSFVVAFMQNEIIGITDDRVLKVFVSSQFDAHIQVEYATGTMQDITVAANSVAVIDLPQIYMMYESEIPRRRSIFITSDVPIVVYAFNSIALSTDTYTAIPIKALGQQYITVNRPNDQYLPSDDPIGNEFNLAVRQSEFMVVAVEDQTEIQVTPTFITEGGLPAGQTRTVVLDRGECYLVKSYEVPIGMGDLTGSRIVSDKPVAVLSGAVRAGIPVVQSSSKDHIIEMLPPVESWGRMYAAVPFAIVSETAVNKVRLVAAEDNTDIQIHDTSRVITRTLARAGDWIEVDLWLPTLYTSSKPFLAAQFMPSRQFRTSVPYSANGDPSMVVLPAVDQYVGSTMFRFPELLPQSMLTTQDFLYYVTVIAEEAAVHTLRVNGVLASQLDPMMYWQTIPGTTMHWTNLQLPLGTYTISCDSGSFGGIMYGLSQADSYANIFGATYDRSQRHTQTPPKYNLVVDCGKIDGTIVDLPQDSGKVVDVLVQTSRCINYSWEVQGPLDASGTTDVHAWVKDLWKDARFVIHAYDSSGAGREWLYEYFAPSLKTPVRVQIDPASTGSPCTLIPIVNTGTKPLHIHGTVLAGDERLHTVPSVIPDTTIEPADTLWVQVCFTSNGKLGPAQARMVVQLDCGLQKDIVVECLNNVQFTTNDLDFGDVRIGDTACAKVPVVNTGTSTITITAILLSAILEPFHLDTQSIALPVELMPADTLWLDVCFTPQAETTYVRTDTVSSAEAGSLWTTYRGRGVRPHVPPVVVDWGKQRVGKPTDMTFTIANTGTARCVVDTTLIARQVKEFMVTNAPFPQQLLPGSTMQGQARFAPSAVQSYADTLHLSVDWPLHERTWVAFIGEGTMPDVRVFDVDMGKVVVGSTKDSTPIVLSADGNEPLTIGGEQHSGVDLAAFSFSTALPVNTQIAQGTSIALPIAFRPSRVGMHEMFIRVLSDAAPFGETDTAIIRIIGEGVPEPVQQLDAELLATTTLPACVLDSGRIVLRNTGNIPVTVDSIHVMIDADPALISTVLPLTIAPSDNLVLGFALLLPKGSPVNITVDVWYSGEHKILTQSIDVVPATPSVAIQAPAMVTAGERLAVPFSVSQQGTLDATQQVTITLATSALQFRLSQTPVVVNVSDITGSWQETITPIVNDANLTLSVGKPVLAPFTITGTIEGTALLSKDGAVVVRAIMSETQCADEATAVAISTMDACGGALRLVRVGAMPQVVAQLKTSPATNVLKLSVHASQKATLSVALLSLEGTEFVLCRNLQLEKGIQDCIFSINSVASGFYGLILRDGSGEQVLPVIIVN